MRDALQQNELSILRIIMTGAVIMMIEYGIIAVYCWYKNGGLTKATRRNLFQQVTYLAPLYAY